MSRLLCCLRERRADMGAALSHPQVGEACDGAGSAVAPPTMADVIRERKKKTGGSGLGTLRRRIALVRRPRDNRPDRGCEHARFIRGVVSSWRPAEVAVLCAALEAGAALRDLATQAELAREPAPALHADLLRAYTLRWWCDVELVGSGWSLTAHRAILSARCTYFRELLQRYPPGCCRVPLEGAGAALSRDELDACLRALYAGRHALHHHKWERGANDSDLDIINGDHNGTCRSNSSCGCSRPRVDIATLRRFGALLGFSLDDLHHDMKYLLDSGELSDARLVFRVEGGGAAYGFLAALELAAHRALLAARSRVLRCVLARRALGAVAACALDEAVLPRRFARALLHAAYTDTVDLSLIGRSSTSPSSNTCSTSNGWGSVTRGSSRTVTPAMLDDAFQLYEIARFLEMPIVVQGCEDAIVEALSPDSLPLILRWSAQTQASRWVARQAARYLRDEWPQATAAAACGALPASALAAALGSDFLQASEAQAARGLLRWSGAGGGGSLAALAPLLRLEHSPPLAPAARRLLPAPPPRAGSVSAWLGRGAFRPPRCFLPYLDELRALLAGLTVPASELARVRRERHLTDIPDTLYMVAAAREAGVNVPGVDGADGVDGAARLCVSPRTLAALLARAHRLKAAPTAVRALALHAEDKLPVYRQIALRAVREMSLPDACADLLINELDTDRERETEDWESTAERDRREQSEEERWPDERDTTDCCRSLGGSLRRAGASASLQHNIHIPIDEARGGSCRRDNSHRQPALCHGRAGPSAGPGTGPGTGTGTGAGTGPGSLRLSACVPDVAMAPNANTHLLTARDYFRHAPPWEYSGVLQLDLGDGATHTPRPGSRAQRQLAREHTPTMSCLRSRAESDSLSRAIELSVIRAYGSVGRLAQHPPEERPHYRVERVEPTAGGVRHTYA